MDNEQKLVELAGEVETTAQDAGKFAERVALYAGTGMLIAASERIDQAIEYSNSLQHRLRELKTFIGSHPELEKQW